MLEITITDEQKITVTLNPVSAAGHAAQVDPSTPPLWTVQSGGVVVTPAPDGLSAVLTSPDLPGDSVIAVSADADLGAGIETISDTITLHVIGAKAQSLGLAAGTAVLK